MGDSFRVIAIISAFNEGDIISPVIGHLVENGIDVYLIDNHSTDDTVQQSSKWLGKGLLEIERFPEASVQLDKFNWTAILQRKEDLTKELPADWFMHYDADEIRESPWPGLNLKEAVRWVDHLGYNCISFRVFNFPPTDDGFKQGDDPRTYFRYWEEPEEFDKIQFKCWKSGVAPISLVPSGGHEVFFKPRHVFPIPFLLRHYPIRGQEHGRRKVLSERKNRFVENERSKGWHRQYDGIQTVAHCFLKDPQTLRRFNLDQARLELLMPEAVQAGFQTLVVEREKLRVQASALEEALEHSRRHAVNLEKELLQFKAHAVNLDHERHALRDHAKNLERERDVLKGHAGNLEQERDSLRGHAMNLERERDALRDHAKNLERERDALRDHAGNLEKERAALRDHAQNFERERDALRDHAGNLEKERDALRGHAANLEQERHALGDHVKNLEWERTKLKLQVSNLEARCQTLEGEIAEMRNSLIWRWSSPLRRFAKLTKLYGG